VFDKPIRTTREELNVKSPAVHLKRIRRMPLFSPRLWLRRLSFWLGAVLVAVMALGFARLADGANDLFLRILHVSRFLPLLVAPAGLAVSVMLTEHVFPGAQGSGIPQVIAALHSGEQKTMSSLLKLRTAVGKMVLTFLGLVCGGSIGREGPTVQISATMMYTLGRALRLPRDDMLRALVLAGGAAGIAAAFNTPLAGVVFAIEELSHSFEARTSGMVMTAVIIAGIVTLALQGNYTYFGVSGAALGFNAGWWAVLLCGAAGGLGGGAFAQLLIWASNGLPGALGRFMRNRPVAFAAVCGLLIGIFGLLSNGSTYGTGYIQARQLVEGHSALPASYAVLKFCANVVSYLSGIPGGIFAPSLAVGAGLGQYLSGLVPGAPSGAVVLLGMVAYFSGVVQAPITATIIVMEMTENGALTIPLLATSMVAFGFSRLICRRPLYGALARRFEAHG
jgi:H+/Cl- antiporter ClcA